jgi:hypothetical protein
MKIQKPDRVVGYVLLIIGVILILIPVLMALFLLLGTIQLPIFVPTPTVSGTDPSLELARVMADAFPLFNIIPTFLLFVVMVYAGSVLMGKGVGLIKEINWKVVKAPEKEVAKTEEEQPAETVCVKPPKKARTEKPQE